MPQSSITPRRTAGFQAPSWIWSWVQWCSAVSDSALEPSRATTPPALYRPTGCPSNTHIRVPSTDSTRGTRSLYFAGAMLVNRSGCSHQ